MPDQKNSIEITRKLSKGYAMALGILVIMLVLSQGIIQFTIHSNENDSRVVNIAGRQRMLSQRINKAAFGLYNSTDEKDYIRYLNELDTSLELWKQSHKGLRNGNEELGLPGKNSRRISDMFQEIEPQYEAIVNAATEIKMITSNLDYNHETLISAIQIIKNNEADFLKGMDAIVFQYDLESKQKITQIKAIEVIILMLSFVILGLEVLFIFRPALRHVKCAMEETEAFMEVNLDMLCVADTDGNFHKVNKKFEMVLGYKADELVGKNFMFFVHEEDITATLDAIKDITENKSLAGFTNRYHCKDGTYKYIEWYSQLGFGNYIYSSARDVTEKRIVENELRKIAVQDELTGLYNRHYFDMIIGEEMDRSDRYNEPLSMMLLDLDHFKKVNDTWGHPVGDELLKLTSRTMGKAKRNSDVLVRFGGEEFIVLMPQTTIEGAAAAAEKIRAEIERNSHPVTGVQTVSIGVVERMKSESFRHWYKRTDDALYCAKESGRNRVVTAEESDNLLLATVHLEWSPEWESGHKELDKQHHDIIIVANRLIEILLSGRGYQDTISQLEILLTNISYHFDYEDKVLAAINYLDQTAHVDMHKNLISKALRLEEAYKKGEVRSSAFLSFLVDDIILDHLMKEDTKFFPYLTDMKNGEL